MADFFAMGGYGSYVWGSYIVVALVMGGIFVWSVKELKSRQAALDRLKAQDKSLESEAASVGIAQTENQDGGAA